MVFRWSASERTMCESERWVVHRVKSNGRLKSVGGEFAGCLQTSMPMFKFKAGRWALRQHWSSYPAGGYCKKVQYRLQGTTNVIMYSLFLNRFRKWSITKLVKREQLSFFLSRYISSLYLDDWKCSIVSWFSYFYLTKQSLQKIHKTLSPAVGIYSCHPT